MGSNANELRLESFAKDEVLKHNSELPLNASEQDTPTISTNKKPALKAGFFIGFVCVRSWINLSGFGRFADGRRNWKLLVRIARILSKLEPKVLLRNYSSVEQIQDTPTISSFLI